MPRVEPNISRKKLFKQLDYEPHSAEQWEIHECDSRYRIPCCGRRWGKSTWAAHEMTYKMFVPNSINWIVGPDYSLGEKEFRIVYNDFKKLGILGKMDTHYNIKQGDMRIYFPQVNSLLEVKSAERPKSLVGEGLDHVLMSESAKHNMSTWQMYVQPALTDKKGSADFPSTPQGFNWYEGLYQLGQSVEHTNYSSWRLPSWTNPILFPTGFDPMCSNISDGYHYNWNVCECDEELIQIFNTVTDMWWGQEYGAQFTAFEGMIYPEFSEHTHVKDIPIEEYLTTCANWWALDFGYNDPFICLDIMIDASDRVYVWREYVVSHRATNEHGLILKNRANPEGFHIDAIAADPRGADEIATLSWIIGSIVANPVGTALGHEAIKRALKNREDGTPGLIIHPSCTNTIRSLSTIHAKEGAPGYELTRGQFDHPADALRYFFNEYFVRGGNFHLADVYGGYGKTEAAGFFRYESGITMGRSFS